MNKIIKSFTQFINEEYVMNRQRADNEAGKKNKQ
jgi:hypothetical protein